MKRLIIILALAVLTLSGCSVCDLGRHTAVKPQPVEKDIEPSK